MLPCALTIAVGVWTSATLGRAELDVEGDADRGLVELIERYVTVLGASDLAAYEALHQPFLDQCRTDANRDAYDEVLKAEVAAHVEAEPRITVREMEPSEIGNKLELLQKVSGQEIRFPARPTHVFELTERAPHPATHPCAARPARVKKFAARHRGDWKLVPQCLSDVMIESLRDVRLTKDAVRRMQGELYDQLDAEVRSELLGQLSSRQTQAAFERAVEVTGSNGKALRLIERLCEDL